MNIQEENSARYFRVQSEREQTLIVEVLSQTKTLVNKTIRKMYFSMLYLYLVTRN